MAAQAGLTAEQVFAGNGSDEVLALAFFAFFQHGLPLVMPDVSYSFYQVYAQLFGIETALVPVDDGLRVDVPGLIKRARQGCAGIVLANPNAPTGRGLPLSDVEELLRACPDRVVLIDEAYVAFGGGGAVPLLARPQNLPLQPRHPNPLVVQTLPKSRSLAGLRVGFALANPHLIEALSRVKNSFNSYPLDRLAQAGAKAALEDKAWFERTRQAVIDTREGLLLALEDLGFEVLPSQANFVFVRHPQRDAAELAAQLRRQSILVRHFEQPRIDQFLRITIGTRDQCARLQAALQSALAA